MHWSTSSGSMRSTTAQPSPRSLNTALRAPPPRPQTPPASRHDRAVAQWRLRPSSRPSPAALAPTARGAPRRLSGGWLHYQENKKWSRRWFLIRDSFLLCYDSREDVTPATASGKPINRRFVLPLGGLVVAYHKTVKDFSFSLQNLQAGELKHEFVFAAESEAIMNVWMEVLFVSTGRELPGLQDDEDRAALEVEAQLEDVAAQSTPVPTRSHRDFTLGKGHHDMEPPRVHDTHEVEARPGPAPRCAGAGARARALLCCARSLRRGG